MRAPFRTLRRQRQRLAIIARMARTYGRPDIAWMAQRYQGQLHNLAAMSRPCDASYVACQIGSNGAGPAIDDLAKSVKRERHVARRIAAIHAFSSGAVDPCGAGEAASLSPIEAASTLSRKVAV